jgi:hypothetical protein
MSQTVAVGERERVASDRWRRFAPVVIAACVFAGFWWWIGFASDAFLEADAYVHYTFSRFALAELARFVDVWGRPFCTAIYAPGAILLGRTGTRLTGLVIALVVALLAMRIAKRQGAKWPALAMIFTLAQPLVFAHSFSELTELPFAMLVGGAFLAYQARRFAVMALLVAMMPLSRPEGFGVALVALVGLVLHRRWLTIAILPLGVAAWSYAGWELYGEVGSPWRWLPDHWPYAAESVYPPGPLLQFVAALPAVVSPVVFPATVWGAVLCLRPLRRGLRAFVDDYRTRCDILVALIPLGVLVVHSLLYWRGLMASNGELRYMLTAAPFWGVLASRGWEWAAERLPVHHPHAWAGLAALAPMFVNAFVYKVYPLTVDDSWHVAAAVARYVKSDATEPSYPFVMASHPGVFFYLDVSPNDATRVRDMNVDSVAHPPSGTRLIWDDVYAQYNADRYRVVTEDAIRKAGWTPDPELQSVIDATILSQVPSTDWYGKFDAPKWLAFKSPEPAAR